MDVRRVSGSYDSYRLTVNSNELRIIHAGLMGSTGAEADSMLHALTWYAERLPKPGETDDEAKAREASVDQTQPLADETRPETEVDDFIANAPDAETELDADASAEADDLLPAPPA